MSKCCIGIGKCQIIYKYLLYNIFVKCAYEAYLLILNNFKYELPGEAPIDYPEMNNHVVIKSLFKYILFILFSLLFIKIIKKQYKNKPERPSQINGKGVELITNRYTLKSTSHFRVVLISFAYSIYFYP